MKSGLFAALGPCLSLGLLLVAGCGAAGATLAPPAPVATPQLGDTATGLLGTWDLALDPGALSATLTPVRESAVIGDTLLLDLGATLKPLCADCFHLQAVSLSPLDEILLDFDLRHPFAADFPRKQYDVFDVRAILLVPLGNEVFNDTLHTPNGLVATNAKIMPTADGFTTHYTERYPGIFKSTIHPFQWFFTEDNPDPLLSGNPIPEHRMTYGQHDTQRVAIVPPSSNPFPMRLVLEASFVDAANNALPPTELGGNQNPVYFLPEGHLDAAYQVSLNLIGLPMQSNDPRPLTVEVTSTDWQAGAPLDGAYPTLTNPGALNGALGTGGIAGVALEIPVILYYSETPTTTTGLGTAADPRIDTWQLTFDTTTSGTFPLLVSLTDARQPADFTGLNSLADLRSFHLAWITVDP